MLPKNSRVRVSERALLGILGEICIRGAEMPDFVFCYRDAFAITRHSIACERPPQHALVRFLAANGANPARTQMQLRNYTGAAAIALGCLRSSRRIAPHERPRANAPPSPVREGRRGLLRRSRATVARFRFLFVGLPFGRIGRRLLSVARAILVRRLGRL